MSEINKPESLRRKYWEYVDANRDKRSLAQLGIYHPSLIDLNVFVETLVETLKESRNSKNLAKVVVGEFFVKEIFLNHIDHSEFLSEGNVRQPFAELPKDKKFDLVLSCLPWGLKLRESENPDGRYSRYYFKDKESFKDSIDSEDGSIRTSYEFIRSLECMEMLSDDGIGICFLPPFFRTFNESKFREILGDNGLHIEAIIKTPDNLLRKVTAIESMFVLISKNKKDTEFIFEPESVDSLIEGMTCFIKNEDSDNIKKGIWLESGSFDGFIKWRYQKELDEIAGDFSKYSQYKIVDICTSINRSRVGEGYKTQRPFENIDNCVYLPEMSGRKIAITNKEDIEGKEKYYFQLVVDTEVVLPEYLASFFNSKLGKTYLESNKSILTIPRLHINILREMEVRIPPIDQQKEIVRNMKRVNELKEKIENYASNLSINPISDHKTLNKVDSMMEIISELSDSDVVRSIIRRGEDISTEFKQTLSLDVAKQTKEKYITESALKTISAFFNTKGGDLVIGVDDDMNITGIDHELDKFHKGDNDKFLNTFKDLFKKHIGPEFYPFINQRIISVNDKKVFLVSCKPTDREVFMNGIDFYVRTTPATDKLEGPSQIDYIRTRFGG